MTRALPQVIQDINVYLDGTGHLGNVKALKLPTIKQIMVEAKGGISANHASGAIEAMELTFKLNVHEASVYWHFGVNTFTNKIPLVFKGSTFQNGKSLPAVAIIKGDFDSIDASEFEAGKEIETDVTIAVHSYELLLDNKQAILVDTKNSICLIGGVDYFRQMRANL